LSANNHVFRYSLGSLVTMAFLMWRVSDVDWIDQAVVVVVV